MRNLKDDVTGVVELGTILMIGIAFAALMVIAYIIFTVRDTLIPVYPGLTVGVDNNASNLSWNATYRNADNSIGNVTGGFDDAVGLILVAVTIFILAIAIGALLMLRGR